MLLSNTLKIISLHIQKYLFVVLSVVARKQKQPKNPRNG